MDIRAKSILASILSSSAAAQARWLKLATYPRFVEWTRARPSPVRIEGGQRERRNNLFSHVADTEGLRDQEILYIEFGVHEGASINWWSDANTVPSSRFLGFDAFEGLPEDWVEGRGRGAFSVDGRAPSTDDPRVRFVVGWFHESLPSEIPVIAEKVRKVFHMDADLYRSTIYALMLIGPHVAVGDIMIFDEFSSSTHEYRAFEDFCVIFGYEFELLGATTGHTQVALKRTS